MNIDETIKKRDEIIETLSSDMDAQIAKLKKLKANEGKDLLISNDKRIINVQNYMVIDARWNAANKLTIVFDSERANDIVIDDYNITIIESVEHINK